MNYGERKARDRKYKMLCCHQLIFRCCTRQKRSCKMVENLKKHSKDINTKDSTGNLDKG